MTEQEWLRCSDVWSMLHIIERSKPSERKIRLFNAAICRRFWTYLPEASQAILSESELLADGLVRLSSDELIQRANVVVAGFDRRYPNKQFPNAEIRIQREAAAAVCYAVGPNELWGAASRCWEIERTEKTAHEGIIRDIFGNPFRSIRLNSHWLKPNVLGLARAIYDQKTFDRLHTLADAIMNAGCDNQDILSHCRSIGLHVRGCWVVDLILGKL